MKTKPPYAPEFLATLERRFWAYLGDYAFLTVTSTPWKTHCADTSGEPGRVWDLHKEDVIFVISAQVHKTKDLNKHTQTFFPEPIYVEVQLIHKDRIGFLFFPNAEYFVWNDEFDEVTK